MYYWQLNEVNEYTGTAMSDNNIRQVSGLINTGKSTTAWDDINGIPDRKKFTEKANQILPQ